MLCSSILLMTMIRPTPALLRLLEDAAGVHLDAAVGVDDDHRRIDAAQGPDRLADEVGIAGRVDDVEPLAAVRRSATTLDSIVRLWAFSSASKSQMLVPASTLGSPLTAPVLTSSLSASVVLPAAAVAAEGNVANVFHLVLRHARFLCS